MDLADAELLERSLRKAATSSSGKSLDAALERLGWQEALRADVRTAVSTLFSVQGESNASSSALGEVVGRGLGLDSPLRVLPPIGRWSAPATLAGGRLVVRGIAAAAGPDLETMLLVARAGDSHVAVEAHAAEIGSHPVEGMDPSLRLAEVTGEVTVEATIGEVDWRAGVALGQIALGHELVGAARRVLEMGRQYALDREQFGKPIARFQAVRHRLAETLVAIEAADSMLELAWLGGGAQAAGMAKAVAGRAARAAAKHCQQVLAGIGFTTEHPLHRYVRRILVLEQLLGATPELTRRLGDEILARKELPGLVPL